MWRWGRSKDGESDLKMKTKIAVEAKSLVDGQPWMCVRELILPAEQASNQQKRGSQVHYGSAGRLISLASEHLRAMCLGPHTSEARSRSQV